MSYYDHIKGDDKMLKKYFKKILSIGAMFEGVDHLILSGISFYGFYIHNIDFTHNLTLWTTPLADTFFGFMSICTGIALHKSTEKEVDKE